jgi:hypothetical protein
LTTELLVILVQIVAGITVLALLWLTARAFRMNPAWGLGVLFLSPLAAAAFGMMHWRKEKLPFLVYMGTFAGTVALLISLFGTWGGWELLKASRDAQQALKSRTLTQAEFDAFQKASLSFADRSGINYQDELLVTRIQRHLDRQAESEEINARARARAEQEAQEEYTNEDLYRRAPEKKERYQLVYKQIKLADARNYIGSTVKVIRKNVQEKEYRLTGATNNALQLAQKAGSGSFSFSFNKRDIEKIRVLTKQPY